MAKLPDYVVIVEGMEKLNFSDASEKITKAAMMAINQTSDFARRDSAEAMRKTYNFPGNYLNPSEGRFYVSERARMNNLQAMLTGRKRGTSLARFMVQNNGVNHEGVVIEMKKGKRTRLEKAFPVRLRKGSGENAPTTNIGLAVRVKGAAKPDAAYKPVLLSQAKGTSVWLLYGISVDQAFRLTKELTADRAAVFLESEVDRLLGVMDL